MTFILNRDTLPVVIPMLDEADYHGSGTDILSHSGMVKLLATCPAQFRYDQLNPVADPTPAMLFGSRFHCLALEPEKFADRYACLPEGNDGRTSAGKAAIAEIQGMHKEAVKFEEWRTLIDMNEALLSHPAAGPFFGQDAEREESLFWRDPASGVVSRARIDLRPHTGRLIGDLKTTDDPSPAGIGRSMLDYGYFVQAVLYEEGAYSCGLRGTDAAMVFISQSKKPPYLVTVWTPSDDAKKIGRRRVAKARRIFAECLARDEWPGYASDIAIVDLPAWAAKQMESNDE